MRQQAPVACAVSAALGPMLATSAALIVLPQSRRPRSVRLIGWVSGPPHRHAERRLRARSLRPSPSLSVMPVVDAACSVVESYGA